MKPVDFAKALGFAILILAVEVAVSYPVVGLYRRFVDPTAGVQTIVTWWVHLAGPLIFFTTGYVLTGRRPARKALLFMAVLGLFYMAVDIGSLMSVRAILAFVASPDVLWGPIQLLAGLAGAYLAKRRIPA